METLDEEEKFSILAHPLRRRILTEMFENNGISFSIMSKEWGLATGTIYHHLSKLDAVISQDSSNLYVLNEDGVSICEWFLQTKKGQVTVKKIDAFTSFTNPIVQLINNNSSIILPIGIVSLLLAFYLGSELGILSLGPFLLPVIKFESSSNLLLFNVIIQLGLLLIYIFTIYFVYKKKNIVDKRIITGYLVSLFPNIFVIYLFFIIDYYYEFELELIFWILISITNQMIFLLVNSSILLINYGSSVEKSITIVLSNLYLILLIAILLI